MKTTVLLPGGFKPPHAGHLQLANSYAKDGNVDKVLVLIGPKDRDGITVEKSTEIWKKLPIDSKVEIVAVDSDNPMTAAFDYVLNMDNNATGQIAMAASSKGDDAKRSDSFVNAINNYKTKSTKDGRFAPKGIIPVKLPIDVSPLLYKGRKDKYDGTGISASVLRQDIENQAEDEFATNYPNIDKSIVSKIFNILVKKKKPIYEIIEEKAVLSTLIRTLLVEGGNVFQGTQRIKKADVDPTIIWLQKKSELSLIDNKLGTTGIKDDSGDLDLGVDKKEIDQNTLIKRLIANGIDKADIKKSGTNVHVKTPILGDPDKGFVQSDFMFNDDVEFMKFSMQGGAKESPYKGVHKHLLLASIAKAQGMKWSYLNGLVDRATNKVISKNPDEIATKLLGQGAKPNDLVSVEAIVKFIKNKPEYEEWVSQARGDLAKDNLELPKKEDLKETIKKLERLVMILEGSFKKETKNLLKEEGPRIDHVEDLTYWKGYEGAKEALAALKNIDIKSTSVKWDGAPSVVFGYDEQNQFIFTDKNAFVNVNNPGKAKSPEEIKKVIVDRGNRNNKDFSAFGDQMSEAFKLFQQSTPKKKGYYKGDMLYFKTPKIENGSYVIDPNVVIYQIKQDSELGKKIGASKIGIVIHSFTTLDGKNESVNIKEFKQIPELLIVPPVLPNQSPKIDSGLLSRATSAVSKISNIGDLLNPKSIEQDSSEDPNKKTKKPGSLNDLPNILYAYTNSRVENIKNLSAKDFESYVASSKLTNTKKETLASYIPKHEDEFNDLFNAVIAISNLKNSIIENLDANNDVQSYVEMPNGKIEKTGEGYVISTKSGLIKLVNRGIFTAANRAKQR
jgi:hypothetical protein